MAQSPDMFTTPTPTTAGRKLPVWGVTGAALLFFAPQLPSSAQALDTGELVLSAWGCSVAHPPGYPLFTWLCALVIRVMPWGTVFWRTSCLSAGLAASVLVVLYQSAHRRLLAVCIVLLPLTLDLIFWRYALLPDVFMLHLALSSALLLLTHRVPQHPWQLLLAGVILALGLGHLQSFVFAAPWVLSYSLAFVGAHRWRWWALSVLLCASVTLALYGSLLWLDVDALVSWGQLHS